MTTFKIIEEVLGRSWCRYYYEVPAETKEEAMEKVKEKEDIDCYNLEELFEFGHQDVDPMDNDGKPTRAYQELLDRAYEALNQNSGFRKALEATGDSSLTHSIGKSDPTHTILTTQEFCSRLLKLREKNRRNEQNL